MGTKALQEKPAGLVLTKRKLVKIVVNRRKPGVHRKRLTNSLFSFYYFTREKHII